MAQPRKQRPSGNEIIKVTNSIIYWDTICHRIMGGRENRLAVLVTCGNCRQDRWVSVHNLDHKKVGKFFTGCCNHCARRLAWREKRRTQPLHRKPTNTGYIKIYQPENPMADKRGEIYEHRLVMSQILGRPLKKWEHIHHKDNNRTNNSPENLELVTTQQNQVMKDMIARIVKLEDILKQYHIPIP